MLTPSIYLSIAYAAYTIEAASFARNVAGAQCSVATTSVTVSATVRQFPVALNKTTFNYSTVPDLPDAQVSGTYQIAASYCEPGTANASRHDTLQILIHGISYTQAYWSGLGRSPASFAPTSNSWIDYASDQGYPTLAIDRLCNGNSTRPNGSLACQTENQVAVLKAIVDDAKTGRYGSRNFTEIILVGHSYGSVIVETFTRLLPSEVDSVVLTGFSGDLARVNDAQARAGGFYGPSASEIDPVAFGSLDANYALIKPERVFIGAFYAGSFNQTVAEFNSNTSGALNFFEIATIRIGLIAADEYQGHVIALNGELDGVACGTPSGSGNCSQQTPSLTRQVSSFYANASDFKAFDIADTGHVLNLHTSSPKSFEKIFDALDQQGF